MSAFLIGSGKIPAAKAKAAEKIARKHGAWLVNPRLPGEGYRHWFECTNRGFPFDDATARAVTGELEAAGLLPLA